jgi:hypothetical protein
LLVEISKEDLLLKFASSSLFAGLFRAAATSHNKKLVKIFAPFIAMFAAASLAHAAPTIDLSGVTSVMQTVQTACLLIGAIIILISLVFSVFSFAGGNIMRGVTGVADVLFGGLVIGLGPTWIASLTGQAVG